MRARDEARRWWERAQHHWRLHFARGYLDVLAAQQAFDEQLSVARDEAEVVAGRQQLAEEALAALADSDELRETARVAGDDLDQAPNFTTGARRSS